MKTTDTTPEEALRQLREIDPACSYCVDMELWHYAHKSTQQAPQWRIWVSGPGVSGQHYYGLSLTGALENAKAGLLSASNGMPDTGRSPESVSEINTP